MITAETMLAAVTGYLLGSIPFGYILYRLRRKQDIREAGSGNIGATNVLRAAGPLAGLATLLLDAGKGYAAVALASKLTGDEPLGNAAAALLAIVGHCFPVFLKFRGGKGVATGLGAFLAIAPFEVLRASIGFASVILATRYVSLASLAGAWVLFFLLAVDGATAGPILFASLAAASLISVRHHANIRRLRTGTEPRLSLDRRERV
jgi:glycerol-3-phosphate acyltransferase PlsY